MSHSLFWRMGRRRVYAGLRLVYVLGQHLSGGIRDQDTAFDSCPRFGNADDGCHINGTGSRMSDSDIDRHDGRPTGLQWIGRPRHARALMVMTIIAEP
jgi:hypothetical protein